MTGRGCAPGGRGTVCMCVSGGGVVFARVFEKIDVKENI